MLPKAHHYDPSYNRFSYDQGNVNTQAKPFVQLKGVRGLESNPTSFRLQSCWFFGQPFGLLILMASTNVGFTKLRLTNEQTHKTMTLD